MSFGSGGSGGVQVLEDHHRDHGCCYCVLHRIRTMNIVGYPHSALHDSDVLYSECCVPRVTVL